jgi:gluconokinase
MALTLAIDVGTSNLKVGVVDSNGELLVLRKSPIKTISRGPGCAEHDPNELKRLIIELSKQALGDTYSEHVTSICASTYHFGLIFLSKEMEPIGGMTVLTDIRAQKTFSDFKEAFADYDVYGSTGCPLLGQFVLPRLYYFFKREPELLKSAAYIGDSKQFLFQWMTGKFVTDASIASASQLFNCHSFDWDGEILRRVGLRREQLPHVEDGTTFTAPLLDDVREQLGLTSGVRVALGLYDGGALAVGLSGVAPGVGIMNVGTTAMFRVPSPTPAFDRDENKRIQAYALKRDLFVNGGALNNAALPLDWLRSKLFDVDLHDPALLEINSQPPLMSLPYLTGERDSKVGPYASGVFFGIRRDHSRLDFARSLLQGVAYSMRYIYDALRENDLTLTELRMGGGGTSWKAWPHMFADTLGIPIVIPTVHEVALIGSAMIAFTAEGRYPDLITASHKMIIAGVRIEPDPARARIHEEHYAFFKELRSGMSELYQRHSRLSGEIVKAS